eukprot:snap_masked-scaffold_23-processed-gene-1.32-mRNA-1 protein AED:1.00 eAED:1.00 QI:0/-1/0/0/-1/1/1/0/67
MYTYFSQNIFIFTRSEFQIEQNRVIALFSFNLSLATHSTAEKLFSDVTCFDSEYHQELLDFEKCQKA